MKILILTDSLGLPRYRPEQCDFEETWPILLKNENRNIHQVSIGAATTQVLLKQVNFQKAFNPDIVILQVGIVDCAPRFMSNKELNFTSALGVFGKGIRFLLNRKWVKKARNISYVNEIEFSNNLLKIQKYLNCPIVAIGIIPANKEYESILPGVTEKIKLYNSVLEKNFIYFINLNDIKNFKGIMSDHHHLNRNGHYNLFKKIDKFLSKINI